VRRYAFLGVGLCLAGCGATQVAAVPARDAGVPVRVTGVAASCAALSPAALLAAARLVFVGEMLPGPTVLMGAGRKVLASPARMRVARYLKGHGPTTVTVETAVRIVPGGITGSGEGIEPLAGQRWKIYSNSRHQPFATSVCAGSAPVTAARAPTGSSGTPNPAPGAALRMWRTFPVQAKPRPIVLLRGENVLDPPSGFRTSEAKLAYIQGRFVLRAPLPTGPATTGGFRLMSAAAAYRSLAPLGRPGLPEVPPLVVTAVHLATATFMTDRGPVRLPTWQFSFQGVTDRASVLAVAAPEVFSTPPAHSFGPPGPGNSTEDSATMSASGTAITISFVGAHAGTAPCDASYTASAIADRRAVAFTITRIAAPVPVPPTPSLVCLAIGYRRTAVLHLRRPLGARVLVSATDGGAIEVRPGG
jgi:hypothetical protein